MLRATTIRAAILECLRAHSGGPLKLGEIESWIKSHYPGEWCDVYADVAGLVIGTSSESYMRSEQFLHRVSRGVYQLDEGFLL